MRLIAILALFSLSSLGLDYLAGAPGATLPTYLLTTVTGIAIGAKLAEDFA